MEEWRGHVDDRTNLGLMASCDTRGYVRNEILELEREIAKHREN